LNLKLYSGSKYVILSHSEFLKYFLTERSLGIYFQKVIVSHVNITEINVFPIVLWKFELFRPIIYLILHAKCRLACELDMETHSYARAPWSYGIRVNRP